VRKWLLFNVISWEQITFQWKEDVKFELNIKLMSFQKKRQGRMCCVWNSHLTSRIILVRK
jgi:hypothetical protein